MHSHVDFSTHFRNINEQLVILSQKYHPNDNLEIKVEKMKCN